MIYVIIIAIIIGNRMARRILSLDKRGYPPNDSGSSFGMAYCFYAAYERIRGWFSIFKGIPVRKLG